MADGCESKQLLHPVFGGERQRLDGVDFKNIDKLDIVGIFPSCAGATTAWKAQAHKAVDDVHMRCFIAPLRRLFDPDHPAP